MDSELIRFEQDLAYNESEEIDRLKEMTKKEQKQKEAKAAKEKKEEDDYDAALQAEKKNLDAIREKRLRAFGSKLCSW